MAQQIIGTVSHGTMRPHDLIPVFLDTLVRVAPAHAHQLPAGLVHAALDASSYSTWWDSEEASDLLHRLFDMLDEHAPEGHYFGAHPGDGADYGFWPAEND